jgi:uncharacterized protein (TIGR02145 family)
MGWKFIPPNNWYKTGGGGSVDPAIKDADGNIYTTVVIGTQTWLLENLKTTKYNDGSAIPNITTPATWAADVTGAFRYLADSVALKTPYGCLYNHFAASNAKGIAPIGYHVPTAAEFTTLRNFVGIAADAKHLKEVLHAHWDASNDTHADNSSGFTAVGCGWWNAAGDTHQFYQLYTGFRTLTAGGAGTTVMYYMTASGDQGDVADYLHNAGVSIRCIKD